MHSEPIFYCVCCCCCIEAHICLKHHILAKSTLSPCFSQEHVDKKTSFMPLTEHGTQPWWFPPCNSSKVCLQDKLSIHSYFCYLMAAHALKSSELRGNDRSIHTNTPGKLILLLLLGSLLFNITKCCVSSHIYTYTQVPYFNLHLF